MVLRDVKITTRARTKPPSMPTIHGVMLGFGFAGVTEDIVQTQPPTAVTSSTAKRPTVFQTVSSTVIRSVSMAPALGAVYMPSSCALAAALVAACWVVAYWVGPPMFAACGPPG